MDTRSTALVLMAYLLANWMAQWWWCLFLITDIHANRVQMKFIQYLGSAAAFQSANTEVRTCSCRLYSDWCWTDTGHNNRYSCAAWSSMKYIPGLNLRSWEWWMPDWWIWFHSVVPFIEWAGFSLGCLNSTSAWLWLQLDSDLTHTSGDITRLKTCQAHGAMSQHYILF